MRPVTLVLLLLALLIGGSAYLSSGQWALGVAVGLFNVLAVIGFISPCILEWGEFSRKRHESYLFIHAYLVTLSVCSSLERAFEVASSSMGNEFHRYDETLGTMGPKEKTEYLNAYFSSDIYKMFLSVLRLHAEQGGDVLKLSSELLAESARIEENGQTYAKAASRKALGFLTLWAMALVLVCFLRFGLSTYFSALSTSLTYLLAIGAFYLCLIVSACVYVHFHTGLMPPWMQRMKGALHEETDASLE